VKREVALIHNIHCRWKRVVGFAPRLVIPQSRYGRSLSRDKSSVLSRIQTRIVQPNKIDAKSAILHVVRFVSVVASGPAGLRDALKIHVSAFPALSRDT
jgi:hypothetical protein